MADRSEILRQVRELLAVLPVDPELLDLADTLRKLARRLEPFQAGPDFACVRFRGQLFHFTPTQGMIVKLLRRAQLRGTPEVRQETLLLRSGSESGRLQDVFKNAACWGVLIVPGESKGTFRLAD